MWREAIKSGKYKVYLIAESWHDDYSQKEFKNKGKEYAKQEIGWASVIWSGNKKINDHISN